MDRTDSPAGFVCCGTSAFLPATAADESVADPAMSCYPTVDPREHPQRHPPQLVTQEEAGRLDHVAGCPHHARLCQKRGVFFFAVPCGAPLWIHYDVRLSQLGAVAGELCLREGHGRLPFSPPLTTASEKFNTR